MSRLNWNVAGTRFYESGVDRGVLFVPGYAGVAWNGLTAVNEAPSGGEARPYYQDGIKYLNVPSATEFEATINAFTYPDEFGICDGSIQPRSGLFLTHQRKKSFGLSYRTSIGNDLVESYGYKLHIVYNALASPTQVDNKTRVAESELNEFSWGITTKPPLMAGYRPTAHVVIDSRTTDPSVMTALEDVIYGTEEDQSRLPDLTEIISVFDTISTLTVVDNGDGTWTATAPYDVIRMLDDDTFEITASTAVFTSEDEYTLSSE